ncbi:MAG: PAS domain S-box protein, partial [Cyclobacteriaceae bacterium]|nr:PAS domain S-box protein [Cyclobacteriaceae bacterium]
MKLDIHEFGVKTFIDLFDYSSDLIYVCNQSGEFVDVNRTVIDSYGYPKASIIGKNFKILTAEDLTDIDELNEITRDVWLNEEEQKIEIWGKRQDGSVFLKEVLIRCGIYFGKKVLIGTGRDITERRRYEQQLIEGKEKLEKLNQELDAFVWKVSHDLRGPLASVKGIINLIQLEGVSPNQQEYCTHMEASVGKLIEFIKELEVIARNKTSEIYTEKIDFKALIEELLKDYLYGSLTENCDIEISVGEIGHFYSDISRLRSVFLNLITNALKYKSRRKP